METKHIYR